MTQRFEYIDITKGIGIFLVVLGHMIDKESILGMWVGSFHVPLFFFLSGYCFNFNKYENCSDVFIKKRIKQILLPALLFTVLISVLSYFLFGYDFSSLKHDLPGAIWFLPILFFCEIIYLYIYKWTLYRENTLFKYLILTLLVTISTFCTFIDYYPPYVLYSLPISIVYYAAGHFARRKDYIDKFYSYLSSKNIVILSIIFFLFIIPFFYAYIILDCLGLSHGYSPYSARYFAFFIAFFGIWGIILLCKKLKSLKIKRICIYLGQNSLVIMAVHCFFIDIAVKYNFIDSFILFKICELIFVMASSLLITEFINRYAKWAIGK